jgi:hypothetical protein
MANKKRPSITGSTEFWTYLVPRGMSMKSFKATVDLDAADVGAPLSEIVTEDGEKCLRLRLTVDQAIALKWGPEMVAEGLYEELGIREDENARMALAEQIDALFAQVPDEEPRVTEQNDVLRHRQAPRGQHR